MVLEPTAPSPASVLADVGFVCGRSPAVLVAEGTVVVVGRAATAGALVTGVVRHYPCVPHVTLAAYGVVVGGWSCGGDKETPSRNVGFLEIGPVHVADIEGVYRVWREVVAHALWHACALVLAQRLAVALLVRVQMCDCLVAGVLAVPVAGALKTSPRRGGSRCSCSGCASLGGGSSRWSRRGGSWWRGH